MLEILSHYREGWSIMDIRWCLCHQRMRSSIVVEKASIRGDLSLYILRQRASALNGSGAKSIIFFLVHRVSISLSIYGRDITILIIRLHFLKFIFQTHWISCNKQKKDSLLMRYFLCNLVQ